MREDAYQSQSFRKGRKMKGRKHSLILDGLQRVSALSVPLGLVHDLNERLELGAEVQKRGDQPVLFSCCV